MKAIGGYFELELANKKHYYPKMLNLNTGRNAFEYILESYNIQNIYMPYFLCDVLLEPLKKRSVKITYYKINDKFEPILNFSELKSNEFLFYINFFGLKDKFINSIPNSTNLIIDNSQAFYSQAIKDIPTFYSVRKFFGVPDGAYLAIKKKLNRELPIDNSKDRVSHLLKRIDVSAEEGYIDFKINEVKLNMNPIKQMSPLTARLLSSINYDSIRKIRIRNFKYLHKHLGKINKIKFDLGIDNVPMVYPFLSDDTNLKLKLISNKVFVATYWPNVIDNMPEDSLEYKFAKQLLPLPIDQRYSKKDLKKIITLIK